jgi:hypothetical protein
MKRAEAVQLNMTGEPAPCVWPIDIWLQREVRAQDVACQAVTWHNATKHHGTLEILDILAGIAWCNCMSNGIVSQPRCGSHQQAIAAATLVAGNPNMTHQMASDAVAPAPLLSPSLQQPTGLGSCLPI